MLLEDFLHLHAITDVFLIHATMLFFMLAIFELLMAGQPVLISGNYVAGFKSMKRVMGIGNAINMLDSIPYAHNSFHALEPCYIISAN